jgi:hypothetical protein
VTARFRTAYPSCNHGFTWCGSISTRRNSEQQVEDSRAAAGCQMISIPAAMSVHGTMPGAKRHPFARPRLPVLTQPTLMNGASLGQSDSADRRPPGSGEVVTKRWSTDGSRQTRSSTLNFTATPFTEGARGKLCRLKFREKLERLRT